MNERGHFLFYLETDQLVTIWDTEGRATEEQVEASDKADYGERGGSFWVDANGRPTTLTNMERPGIAQVFTDHA